MPFGADPGSGTFGYRGVVGHKIITGVDLNAATVDGSVNVNFGQNWDFDDSIAAGAFDFKSTMIHELLHAVGFGSTIFQDGSDFFGVAAGGVGTWAPFDQFIQSSAGSIIDAQFKLDGTAWNTALIGGTGASPAVNGLYFGGDQAKAAFSGNPVPLYSPNPFESGSSVHHLDDNFFTGVAAKIMNAQSDTGQGIRSLSGVEQAVLRDLGFTVVPEPHEYALITIFGLSIVVAIRRKKLRQLADA